VRLLELDDGVEPPHLEDLVFGDPAVAEGTVQAVARLLDDGVDAGLAADVLAEAEHHRRARLQVVVLVA
jgi:hypothetical protein